MLLIKNIVEDSKFRVELENSDGDYHADICPEEVDIPSFNSSIEADMWIKGFTAVLDVGCIQYKIIEQDNLIKQVVL